MSEESEDGARRMLELFQKLDAIHPTLPHIFLQRMTAKTFDKISSDFKPVKRNEIFKRWKKAVAEIPEVGTFEA